MPASLVPDVPELTQCPALLRLAPRAGGSYSDARKWIVWGAPQAMALGPTAPATGPTAPATEKFTQELLGITLMPLQTTLMPLQTTLEVLERRDDVARGLMYGA